MGGGYVWAPRCTFVRMASGGMDGVRWWLPGGDGSLPCRNWWLAAAVVVLGLGLRFSLGRVFIVTFGHFRPVWVFDLHCFYLGY